MRIAQILILCGSSLGVILLAGPITCARKGAPPPIGIQLNKLNGTGVGSQVYNASFSPTSRDTLNDLQDRTITRIDFFIGTASDRSAISISERQVNPAAVQAQKLVVTMSCAFCRDSSLEKSSIELYPDRAESTHAFFQIQPDRSLTKDQSGSGNVIFQVTSASTGVLYDNVVVPVTIGKAAGFGQVTQRNEVSGNMERPPESRDMDLTVTCFADSGGIEIQLLPTDPILVSAFKGRHLGPGGQLRVFTTGLEADTLKDLVASDYASLASVIQQNVALQKALAGDPSSIVRLSSSNNQLTPSDEDKLLDTFYAAGRDLYRRLFLANPDLAQLAGIVDSYEMTGRPLRIRVESQGVFVPWQILHPLVARDAQKFWGFRYELIVDPQGDQKAGYYGGSMQYSSGPLIFAKYRADQSDSDADRDVAALGDKQIEFLSNDLKIKGVLKADSRGGFEKLLGDNKDKVQMIVAYTHAENGTVLKEINPGQFTSSEDIAGAKLRFARTEFLSARDLDSLPSQLLIPLLNLDQHPVVFLNGCETAGGGYFPTRQFSFPAIFLHFGARGVIATDAPVWEMFGFYFGKSLLQNLNNGQPVSLALLNGRKDFLKSSNNPLGLLYAYYGGANAVLSFK